MWTLLGNFLGPLATVKNVIIGAIVVAMLTVMGVLWVEKNSAEKANVTLQSKNADLQAAVLKKQIEVNNLQISIDTLQEVNQELADKVAAENETNEEIDNATPEKDGPVAPVLRDALDAIGRMLSNGPKN